MPEYLSAGYLNEFISSDLREKFKGAVLYVTKTGQEANGIDATALADICDVYITALDTKDETRLPITAAGMKAVGTAKN